MLISIYRRRRSGHVAGARREINVDKLRHGASRRVASLGSERDSSPAAAAAVHPSLSVRTLHLRKGQLRVERARECISEQEEEERGRKRRRRRTRRRL